jgi:hypothetical protein
MSRPEKLNGALSRSLKGLNLDLRMREARAMALWPDVVGPAVATKSRALYVNRGTMTVAVTSSSWSNQLNLMKDQILMGLEARVGPGVIRDIRYKQSPLEDGSLPMPGMPFKAIGRPKSDLQVSLPETELAAIRRQVEAIPDAKLAATIEKTLLAQARRRYRLRQSGWTPCRRCAVLFDPQDPTLTGTIGAEQTTAEAAPLGALCPVCRMEIKPLVEPG